MSSRNRLSHSLFAQALSSLAMIEDLPDCIFHQANFSPTKPKSIGLKSLQAFIYLSVGILFPGSSTFLTGGESEV